MKSNKSKGLFICGHPSAMVDVLTWSLAQHHEFWASASAGILFRLLNSLSKDGVPGLYRIYKDSAIEGTWLQVNNMFYPEFAEHIGSGIGQLFAARAQGKYWIDSSAENVFVLEEVLYMLPEAKAVIVRQSLSYAIASHLAKADKTPSQEVLIEIAKDWQNYNRVIDRLLEVHKQRIIECHTETLLSEPDSILLDVFDYLDEDFDIKVLQFFDSFSNEKSLFPPKAIETMLKKHGIVDVESLLKS